MNKHEGINKRQNAHTSPPCHFVIYAQNSCVFIHSHKPMPQHTHTQWPHIHSAPPASPPWPQHMPQTTVVCRTPLAGRLLPQSPVTKSILSPTATDESAPSDDPTVKAIIVYFPCYVEKNNVKSMLKRNLLLLKLMENGRGHVGFDRW